MRRLSASMENYFMKRKSLKSRKSIPKTRLVHTSIGCTTRDGRIRKSAMNESGLPQFEAGDDHIVSFDPIHLHFHASVIISPKAESVAKPPLFTRPHVQIFVCRQCSTSIGIRPLSFPLVHTFIADSQTRALYVIKILSLTTKPAAGMTGSHKTGFAS